MSMTRTVVAACAAALAVPAAVAAQTSDRPVAGPPAVCAPISPLGSPASAVLVAGGKVDGRTLFGPGDTFVVRGGSAEGVRTGDEYLVRRVLVDRLYESTDKGSAAKVTPFIVHTAGVVRIVDSDEHSSVALVTLGCDGIQQGDYLERMPPQDARAASASAEGKPDFENHGRVLVGSELRGMGAIGDFMVFDRGSDDGVAAGQVVTVFRQSPAGPDAPPAAVATARVHAVQSATATIRIESSVDAVYAGDLVAVHR